MRFGARADLRPGIRRLFRLPLRTTSSIHADADEELASLIAARVDDYVGRGMQPDAARAEALRRLGISLDAARHQLHHSAELRERHMRLHEQLESFAQDVRYAARGLLRRPAFTIIAVLTLAIGIGATTALFSAVNVLLLRPLPYARPNELMSASLVVPARDEEPSREMVWSYLKFTTLRDAQDVFSQLSLYTNEPLTVTSDDPERIDGEAVGATYFRTLGLSPIAGHDFDPSIDAHGGAPREAIVSYAFWQRRFNADPGVIGHTIDLDRDPYTIIGVAPREFLGLTGKASVFIPITTRLAADLAEPRSHEFSLVARRKPGVSTQQAMAAVALLGQRVDQTYPDQVFPNAHWGAVAKPLDAVRVTPAVQRSLLTLFGAVGLVLLIACVNVASLLLGRAATRQREIAVRLAIGAGRARLVRLLLTESMLLALAGGIASIAVAWVGVHALALGNPATTARGKGDFGLGAVTYAAITLDWTALAFTLGVAVFVGLLFGLTPALNATRASLTGALKDNSSGTLRAGSSAARRALVVTEVALALVLLAGSGLMLRSLGKLLAIDPGFDAHNVLTLRLTIPPGGLARDSMPGFYTQLIDRINSVPGVTNVGLNNCPPLNGGCNGTVMRRLDRPGEDLDHGPSVGVHWATAGWFSTLHIPLKRGRMFGATDGPGAPKVVVINETAARKLWPDGDAIGKHVEVGQGGLKDAEVIGVVGDVRQNTDSLPRPDVYASYAQSPRGQMMIFVRGERDAAAIAPEIRRAIHEIAPRVPVYDVQSMEQRAGGATAQARFSAMLLAFFGLTALSLASIGIYGVISLAVSARTREIGIRIALGAERSRVLGLVIREGMILTAAGAAIGMVGALASTRVLRTMLFDLTPSDPATYATILAVLGVAAVTACWIPARRAARVDPVIALRTE